MDIGNVRAKDSKPEIDADAVSDIASAKGGKGFRGVLLKYLGRTGGRCFMDTGAGGDIFVVARKYL